MADDTTVHPSLRATFMLNEEPIACRWCGYDRRRGDHGIIGHSDDPEKVKVMCHVPRELTEPRIDDRTRFVEYLKQHNLEHLIDG